VDLELVNWNDGVLSGTSRVVAGEDYELYLTEPDGWTAETVTAADAMAGLGEVREQVRRITLRGPAGGRLAWTVRYRRSR
jgi:hypothetical protein